MSRKNDDFPKALKPFRFHGVEFTGKVSGDDWLANCPFTGKRDALSVNCRTGQWSLHTHKAVVTHREGNIQTWYETWLDWCASHTEDVYWEALFAMRALPRAAWERWGVCYHEGKNRWLIPVRNARGYIQDVRCWTMKKGGKTMGSPSIPKGGGTCLWNLHKLARTSDEAAAKKTLWVCEGEWDAMALHWLMRGAQVKGFEVCAVPGSDQMKDEWMQEVRRFGRAVVAPDLDEAGDKMAEKWWKALQGWEGELTFIDWPDSLPQQFDMRDFVVEQCVDAGKSKRSAVKQLLSWRGPKHKSMPYEGQRVEEPRKKRRRRRVGRVSWEETLRPFEKALKMTQDLRDALLVCCATHISCLWTEEPLWVFIIGPPSCGKSELLMAMREAPDVFYQSTLSPTALVSGFQGDNKRDPSIIPRMIDHTVVLKDWTEMLSAREDVLAQVAGLLRNVFDGQYDRNFGNFESRHYKGKFNMLAGTTSEIYRHSDAAMGERWLRIHIKSPDRMTRRAMAHKAILGMTGDNRNRKKMSDALTRFLEEKRDQPPAASMLSGAHVDRLWALSEVVGFLRTKATWERTGYQERELMYTPEAELPTRLSKQLSKLTIALMVALGEKGMDPSDEVHRVVEKVAFNTAAAFNLDTLEAAMRIDMDGRAITTGSIMRELEVQQHTAQRRLDEAMAIKLMKKHGRVRGMTPGSPRYRYAVPKDLSAAWKLADIKWRHIEDSKMARDRRTEE